MKRVAAIFLSVLSSAALRAEDPVLSATVRGVPGEQPTPILRYSSPAARGVAVAGQWDHWSNHFPLVHAGGEWQLDTRTLPAAPGRVEYKFIVDGVWESGDNRFLFLNDNKLLERPPDLISSALLEKPDEIVIFLKRSIPVGTKPQVKLEPAVRIASVEVASSDAESHLRGCSVAGNVATFVFDPAVYGQNLSSDARVAVAGNFNRWSGDGAGGAWLLKPSEGLWRLSVPLDGIRSLEGGDALFFKFVINGSTWLQPPPNAPNAQNDGKGNVNLRLDRAPGGGASLTVHTAEPLRMDVHYTLVIDGLADRRIRQGVAPGRALDAIVSTKPLGALLDSTQQTTTYRLWAPRASRVNLCFFDTPEYEAQKPAYHRLRPALKYPMWKDVRDGVWEITTVGLDTGRYYSFTVDGPEGEGEGFNGDSFIGDPYAMDSAGAANNGIVIDPSATNKWFGGWTDQAWRAPRHEDMVIYETHLRGLTIDPSSGVTPSLRGRYAGLLDSDGKGTGLDHLRRLGVNMIEFLPLCEFNDGPAPYNWGYSTVFYFSPENSYASDPLRGSQHFEYKHMVNELHRRGFGVIMDVVYNHVGGPNLFAAIDRKYYFRLTPDFQYLNFSGVGNDVRSEAPMMRRLIVDNMAYWAREFHVDGFRLDLAELVDMETLRQARAAVLKVNPNAIVISEPWSFRGEHKQQLRGTGWCGWNNDFRYAIKDFVRGRADREWVKKVIAGSTDIWTANPLQAINYVESHDDMALVDELSRRQDHNGTYLSDDEARMNRMTAAILFTSLGIPMVAEGQEFLRSKKGISNSFDKGDEGNALRWTDRDRPIAKETLSFYRDMIALRKSEAGASFRQASVGPDYYRWIGHPDGRVLGYIVNAQHTRAGRGFVVLLNASDNTQEIRFALPQGNWRVISDGRSVNTAGLPGRDILPGGKDANVSLAARGVAILMDGF